jgi:DNA repair protein RecO (recombination protein O)
MASRRHSEDAAYVVHRYDWSESSLILELFTRLHGRVAVVAKGAKKPSSNFRPILLPLQRLDVMFGGEGEIRTLKGAEWSGGHVMPTGEALWSGYYLNELLLRLLPRDDAHPVLFDHYSACVQVLASGHGEAVEPALRAFELLLLRELGFLPALDRQTLAQRPLDDDAPYALQAEGGLVAMPPADARPALPGALWRGLEAALQAPAPFNDTLRQAAGASALKPLLRALLHYHCGVASLRTRQLVKDLQSL